MNKHICVYIINQYIYINIIYIHKVIYIYIYIYVYTHIHTLNPGRPGHEERGRRDDRIKHRMYI